MIYIHIHALHIYYTYAPKCTIHIHMHVYTYMYMDVHIYIHVYTCMYVYACRASSAGSCIVCISFTLILFKIRLNIFYIANATVLHCDMGFLDIDM